ncbi:restriction endonuclease subunit S [Metamycoplasma alkalescens]|uniref:Type I restriction enzyme S subunit n=2 Tax=Metamycoplasma alkalescens TaxID=45363 RepID=A0A318U405_9BACT|nr:restriction endonuclease subunit S [Metamycoplasma alkalescens]PYF42176.1 type I restriction enzyme S subunit [Metamycoplasma alkalescens]
MGNVGKAGTVFHRKGLFYATSHCGILSKKQNTPNSFFANSLSRNIKKYVTWVAMPMLTTNTMSNLKILITKNVFEQNKISDLIDNINLLITLHQRGFFGGENEEKWNFIIQIFSKLNICV